MSKNIGFTKKTAQALAKQLSSGNPSFGKDYFEAYAQREDCWPNKCRGDFVHQWIVIIQKRRPLKERRDQ